MPSHSETDGTLYPRPKDLEAIDITEQYDFAPNMFTVPERFQPFISSIVLPEGMLKDRWSRLATRILDDFKGQEELHIIVLMNGGYIFYEDLKRCLDD